MVDFIVELASTRFRIYSVPIADISAQSPQRHYGRVHDIHYVLDANCIILNDGCR